MSSEVEHSDTLAIPNSHTVLLQDVHRDMSVLTGIVEEFAQFNICECKTIDFFSD